MSNPFLRRLEKQGRQGHGRKAEKAFVRKVRLTPASGAMSGAKGDVVTPEVLIEVKSTVHGSLSVKKEWLDKITGEAMATNKIPALAINFVTGSGEPVSNGAWVAVPVWAFTERF